MPPHYPVKTLYPDTSTFVPIELDHIESPLVRKGVDAWQALRGQRKYPRRAELEPHRFGRALSNMVLVQVVDSGADFLLRIVGDEVHRAYAAPLAGRLLSDIQADLPRVARKWRLAYRQVLATGAPLAVRIEIGWDVPEVNFSRAEVACVPLGESDRAVDHLLTFGAHTLQITEPGSS